MWKQAYDFNNFVCSIYGMHPIVIRDLTTDYRKCLIYILPGEHMNFSASSDGKKKMAFLQLAI